MRLLLENTTAAYLNGAVPTFCVTYSLQQPKLHLIGRWVMSQNLNYTPGANL